MNADDVSYEARQAMQVEGTTNTDALTTMLFAAHIARAASEDELLRMCLKTAEDLMSLPRESTMMTPEMERRRKQMFMAMLLAQDRLRKVLEMPKEQRTYQRSKLR